MMRCYKAKTACKMGWRGSLHADTDDGQWPGSSKLGIHAGGKDEDGPAKWSPRLGTICTQACLETYRMWSTGIIQNGANHSVVPMSALTGRKWVEAFMELPAPKWVQQAGGGTELPAPSKEGTAG